MINTNKYNIITKEQLEFNKMCNLRKSLEVANKRLDQSTLMHKYNNLLAVVTQKEHEIDLHKEDINLISQKLHNEINTTTNLSQSLKTEQEHNTQLGIILARDKSTIQTLNTSLKTEQETNTQLGIILARDQITIQTLNTSLKTEQDNNTRLSMQLVNDKLASQPSKIEQNTNQENNMRTINQLQLDKLAAENAATTLKLQLMKADTLLNTKECLTTTSPSVYSRAIVNGKNQGIFKYLHSNKQIKTIRNVYQHNYVNGAPPSGLGDFIRGCYFLMQYCADYKFEADFCINHPINLFTHCSSNNFNCNTLSVHNVAGLNNFADSLFDNNNYIIGQIYKPSDVQNFSRVISQLHPSNHCVNIFTNLFPYKEITKQDKVVMKKLFMPNDQMVDIVDNALNILDLTKKRYSTIHIRLGDDFLINHKPKLTETKYSSLVKDVQHVIDCNRDELLLICDNNIIKDKLKKSFKNLKVLIYKINHFGENVVQTPEEVKNNLTDFYLMSNSNAIHSFSCYKHGTGFSFWCAKTYDIPYSCKYIG